MKSFFDWLLKIFTPDKSKYVRNIKETPSSYSGDKSFVVKRIKKPKNPLLAWVLTSAILENVENKQGVSTDITLKTDHRFSILDLNGKFEVNSRKRGLSVVVHRVEFTPGETDRERLIEIVSSGKFISFLYRNQEGDIFFLGERAGLRGKEDENGAFVFTGEENDVFYKVSQECFTRLLPNID